MSAAPAIRAIDPLDPQRLDGRCESMCLARGKVGRVSERGAGVAPILVVQ
jgi:hypothetical protein